VTHIVRGLNGSRVGYTNPFSYYGAARYTRLHAFPVDEPAVRWLQGCSWILLKGQALGVWWRYPRTVTFRDDTTPRSYRVGRST